LLSGYLCQCRKQQHSLVFLWRSIISV